MSRALDKQIYLSTAPEHDQTQLCQSNEFPSPLQMMTSFQTKNQRHCPYPKDISEEENSSWQEQIFDLTQDKIIHSPLYSSVLLLLPRVLNRTVEEVTSNTQ